MGAATFSIREVVLRRQDGSFQEILLTDENAPDGPGSITSVLIGRNGAGKSAILRDIANSFRALSTGKTYWRSGGVSVETSPGVERFTYVLGGVENTIRLQKGRAGAKLKSTLPGNNVVPSRIVAASFTPFDRFIERDDYDLRTDNVLRSIDTSRDFRYAYLGYKSWGLKRPIHRLYRSVERAAINFFLNREKLGGVASVFHEINRLPYISVRYEFGWPEVSRGDFANFIRFCKDRRPSKKLYNMATKADDDEYSRNLLFEYWESFYRCAERFEHQRFIEVHFDFGKSESDINFELFLDMRRLTSMSLLTAEKIWLQDRNYNKVDVASLSSGELNIFGGVLGIASVIEDGALVLVDEPENSLHPEWQVRYAEILSSALANYGGCHYLVATHSPIIAAGAAKLSTRVCSIDGLGCNANAKAIIDASPDEVLVNAFGVFTPNNSYLRHELLTALTLAGQGRTLDPRYTAAISVLQYALPKMKADDPLKIVMKALVSPSVVR